MKILPKLSKNSSKTNAKITIINQNTRIMKIIQHQDTEIMKINRNIEIHLQGSRNKNPI